MATYKVIQDIESEDKLLGPLTLKQFIFAIIAAACAYLSFLIVNRGVWFLAIFLLPPLAFFGFMAFPWSREQKTEIWLLAKLRFMLKPRKRVWDQSGMKDTVTITAPPKEEKNYTNGLSAGEVKSRLKALANTIDSRGWAVKNVNVNLFAEPQYAAAGNSDRLIDVSVLPQDVDASGVSLADDIMDEMNNPTAQNLSRMINASTTAHRQQIVEQVKQQAAAPSTDQTADYWFMNQPSGPVPSGQAVFDAGASVVPGDDPMSGATPTADDAAILADAQTPVVTGTAAYGDMPTIQPLHDLGQGTPQPAAQPQQQKATPTEVNPAILELAKNDDLNVATIARQANKKAQELGNDEVVISLH